MDTTPATFKVEKIFELASRSAVVLQGQVESGLVRPGMQTKVLVDGQLYMVAVVENVEFIDGPGAKSAVGLVLRTPEQEVRRLWQTLCHPGDVLPVQFAAS